MGAPERQVVSPCLVIERSAAGSAYRSAEPYALTIRYVERFWPGVSIAVLWAITFPLRDLVTGTMTLVDGLLVVLIAGMLGVLTIVRRPRWTLTTEAGELVIRDDRWGRPPRRIPAAEIRGVHVHLGSVLATLRHPPTVAVVKGLAVADAMAVREAIEAYLGPARWQTELRIAETEPVATEELEEPAPASNAARRSAVQRP